MANLDGGLGDKYGGDALMDYQNRRYHGTISVDYNNRIYGEEGPRKKFYYTGRTYLIYFYPGKLK